METKKVTCPGCNIVHAVRKFASNNAACPSCSIARKKPASVASLGVNITPTVVGHEDIAREAMYGTPANPRAALESLQHVLRDLEFTPDRSGAWWYDAGGVDGHTVSRIKVQISPGMSSAPDPKIAHVTVLTQLTASVDELIQKQTLPPEVRAVLVDLHDRVAVEKKPAQARRYVATVECSECGNMVPEWVTDTDGVHRCIDCAGDEL